LNVVLFRTRAALEFTPKLQAVWSQWEDRDQSSIADWWLACAGWGAHWHRHPRSSRNRDNVKRRTKCEH